VAKIIRNFSVGEAQAKLQDFKNLAAIIGPLRKGMDARHITRLLAAAHYPRVHLLLQFLDGRAAAWPTVLQKLLQQTSETQFRQTLAELHLLSHLNKQNGTDAKPKIVTKNLKHYDIDATAAGVAAKIEIYSPSDFVGMQLFDGQISPLFKFLEVPIGFHIELTLDPVIRGNANYASGVSTESQVERWLQRIREEAETWINASTPIGVSKTWDGPNKSVRLTAKIRKISENGADRLVTYVTGTRSTESRFVFDHGDPLQVRRSSWGKKIFEKMSDRQCGEYEQGAVRLLMIDFSGLDTSSPDFFRTTRMGIFSRIESALQIASADAGAPLPYDGILLAWVDDPLVLAPAIELHPHAAVDLQKFLGAAGLTGSLVSHV
jgi:hypothetical protein